MLSKNKERKLIEMYPLIDNVTIAKMLGTSIWVIKKKAEELGLKKEAVEEWIDQDIDYLMENYSSKHNQDLSVFLGRTKMEIDHFAFRMGLSKNKDFFSGVTISEEEKVTLKEWSSQYNRAEHGSSRGNFILGKILEVIFPMSQVYPEHPIGNLRLDLYVPRMCVGFEFQGVQHTEYNNFHYKTKADFFRAQVRDYKKSETCELLGIPVVYVSHDEELSISLIRAKLEQVM